MHCDLMFPVFVQQWIMIYFKNPPPDLKVSVTIYDILLPFPGVILYIRLPRLQSMQFS